MIPYSGEKYAIAAGNCASAGSPWYQRGSVR